MSQAGWENELDKLEWSRVTVRVPDPEVGKDHKVPCCQGAFVVLLRDLGSEGRKCANVANKCREQRHLDQSEDIPHLKAPTPATILYHVLSLSLAIVSWAVSW